MMASVAIRAVSTLHLIKVSRIPNALVMPAVAQAKEKTLKKTGSSPQKVPKTDVLDVKAKELKFREEQINQEEANLRALKKDIEAKIQQLKALEAKVSKLLKERDEREEKRLVQLARVFESTPPEQAGSLLSKLDVKTAAEILYRMNGRKAGKIWGYVNADRAVKISEELTKLKDNR